MNIPVWGCATRMATMEAFDKILNWKLQRGSHPSPGPDGGTCINEAAIVAAGFPYQAVVFVESMPACFSRPVCRLAIRLNDMATDEQRQRLLPFVGRLACAGTPRVPSRKGNAPDGADCIIMAQAYYTSPDHASNWGTSGWVTDALC